VAVLPSGPMPVIAALAMPILFHFAEVDRATIAAVCQVGSFLICVSSALEVAWRHDLVFPW